MEVLELRHEVLGADVGPGRQHLADLDVEGAEVLEGLADGPGPLLLAVGPVLAVAAERRPQTDRPADLTGQQTADGAAT